MHKRRRLTGALVVLLAFTGCDRVTTIATAPTSPAPVVASPTSTALTPEQVHYLTVQAELAAQTAAFLDGVHRIALATPPQLWRIMWCESGRPYALPANVPKWDAYNQSGSSASGGAQFLDSTWRAWRGDAGAQYARAAHAPWFVQLLAAQRLYESAGTSPWRASAGCWS